MPTSYPSLTALHQAHASEPARIARPWTYWSEEVRSDGSLEVTITLTDGSTEVWVTEPGSSTLTFQQA